MSIGVVPLSPRLATDERGRKSPVPLIRWRRDGPLVTPEEIKGFWDKAPDSQLAISLSSGLTCIDVDIKNLPAEGPPAGGPLPVPLPGAYAESTKSGGRHYLFKVNGQQLPEGRRRIIHMGGYVDILADGILVVAPSKFLGERAGYDVLVSGGIPIFSDLSAALEAYAGWLAPAVAKRLQMRASNRAEELQELRGHAFRDPLPEEITAANLFIDSIAGMRSIAEEGAKNAKGYVDRSLTEFLLARVLKNGGFSIDTAWALVNASPHTKSPRDRRRRSFFETHVWARIDH